MPVTIIEGAEVDTDYITERSGNICRLGPINVSEELRVIIETMAEEEMRSMSNTCRLLIERGLKYTEALQRKR